MTTQLMYLIRNQEQIMKLQAGIIDELFALACKGMSEEDINSIEPLLISMKDAAERKERML